MHILSLLAAAALAAATSASSQADLTPRDAASDIWNAIQKAASCAAAQGVVSLLKGVATLGDDAFDATLIELCKISGAEDDDVCEGAVSLEGPIVAHDLRNIIPGSHTAQWFAVTFLGLCAYPDITPYTISFPKPKPPAARPVPSGQEPIQIVQYSDIHVDPFYTVGSNYNCTKPSCCRVYDSSDAPGNNSYPAGTYGEATCDAPLSLEQSMYQAINNIVPDAKFVLFTGDIVDHIIWNTTRPQNTLDMNDAYSRMSSSFDLVYGTAGNHESSPVNAFQPVAAGNANSWVYDVLSAAWTQWVGASAASQADSTGYYSVAYPGGGLRIINLNTNLYYIENFWMYEEPMEHDPNGQFAWLVNELQAAEDAGDRVYIIGHMPMGTADAFHDYSNYFDQITNRYENTIAALFFGHTHKDEFEVGYSNYSARSYQTASAMSYICPSMEPGSGYPAFRVYSVDPVTYAVLDSVTYSANMADPSYQTSGPVWTKEYSAKDAYGPLVSPAPGANDELTPAFWHNVTVAFESNQDNFNKFLYYQRRGYNPDSCTGTCATQEICQIRSMRSQDNCQTPTPGVHFGKRDLDANGIVKHHDDCGPSVTRRTLNAVVGNKDVFDHLVNVASKR